MTSRHKSRIGIAGRGTVSFLTLGLFMITLLPWAGCGVSGDRQGGERFIADIEGISLNPSSTTLKVGGSILLSTQAAAKGGTVQRSLIYSWSSDHPQFASVSAGGLVRGIAEGTAWIRATLRNHRSADAVVFVVDSLTEDSDGDSVTNETDNAPFTPNPDQTDTDGDGIGDVADPDLDGYGVVNPSDWSLAGQLPKGLYDHAAAYWNGVLYVSGGFGPGGRDPGQSVNTREIYGFTVLPDLTLGDYTVSTIPAKTLNLTTSLGNVTAVVTGIDGHGMFAANGFLYLVGGKFQYERTDCYPIPSQSQLPCNIPTPTAWNHAIFYAPIQPDGSVSGEWTEIPLPDSIGPYTLGAAVYHGYLYLAGGWDGGVNTDRVFRAPMIANGEIGDWKEETRLPEGVSKHALVAAQGHLYVIGGNTGGAQSQEGYSQGYQNEVYVAPIDESDPLGPRVGSWSLTSSLPDTWIDHEAVALGNTLWVIGGRNVNEYYYAPSGDGGGYYTDYTIHPTVQTAQVRPDGTLTPWQDYNELPVPVLRHAAVAAESGVIFLTGGSSGQEEPPAPESCQGTQAELCSAAYIRESGVYVLDPFK